MSERQCFVPSQPSLRSPKRQRTMPLRCTAFLSVVIVGVVIYLYNTKYWHNDYSLQHLKSYWKDIVIYQVYPRSLFDGEPDGTGDLKGITSKADYLQDLGIGAVWLSPIYTSPMADFGYDVANFTDIDPIFGDMADFDELLDTFHQKGLKVLMDFVPNHSSDEHEWFIRSVKKEDPYTDYYIWNYPIGFNEITGDPIPPNNWLSAFRGSAWTWMDERLQFYYHSYLPKQPDLNYRNPYVREEMLNVLRFWLDKGVDGFRIDALKHLFEVEDIYQDEPVAEDSGIDDPMDYHYLNHTLTVNQPDTYMVLREWRELIDLYLDKMLMVEVSGTIDQVMAYYGNETVPLADFPFNFLMIDKLHNRSDLTGDSLKSITDLWLDNMPEGKWPNWLLGSHDNSRVGSRLGDDLVDALNMMSLLLPGTPVTLYGEEIGMTDTWISWEDTKDPQGCRYGPEHYAEHSRDPERTPMQWDNSSYAGFTKANSTWLPINANYKTLNVKAQTEAEVSHLKVYRSLTHLRKEEAFSKGQIAYPVVSEDVFSFVRYTEGAEMYLVVINTSEREIVVDLHDASTMELPQTGIIVLRSVTDTSEGTTPGSEISLDNVKLVGGEGLVVSLGLQN